jgi:hypothetical protein
MNWCFFPVPNAKNVNTSISTVVRSTHEQGKIKTLTSSRLLLLTVFLPSTLSVSVAVGITCRLRAAYPRMSAFLREVSAVCVWAGVAAVLAAAAAAAVPVAVVAVVVAMAVRRMVRGMRGIEVCGNEDKWVGRAGLDFGVGVGVGVDVGVGADGRYCRRWDTDWDLLPTRKQCDGMVGGHWGWTR